MSDEVLGLLNALDNDNNSNIMELTTRKIKMYKNNILQKLQLPRNKLKEFHKKLKEYRYCGELPDFNEGNYIRWIPLNDPDNINLTRGAIFCDVQFINKKLQIICKSFRNKIFRIKYDEVVVFQKLSDQEQVILSVMDHLEK